MVKLSRFLLILSLSIISSGCALISGFGIYAMKSGTANELSTEARQSIIDEATEKAMLKMQANPDDINKTETVKER